jgi:hypothetical protein
MTRKATRGFISSAGLDVMAPEIEKTASTALSWNGSTKARRLKIGTMS